MPGSDDIRDDASRERLQALQAELAATTAQNRRLADTLRDARDQIVALKEQVDALAQPPSGYGVFLTGHGDGTVDIVTAGRKLRVAVSPEVEPDALRRSAPW
jgi:proteasome-associated ATPase